MTYIKPIPLEDLPYTPVELGDMLETGEKEKEIEVEGYGKGRLVISKQNKNKPFFYADEANIPANKKAAKQLQIAETLVNAPVQLAPFLAPFGAKSKPTNVILQQPGKTQKVPITKGGQTIFQQRKSNKQTLKRLKTEERIEDVTGFGDKSIIIDDVMSQRPFTTAEIVKVAKRNKISFTQAEEYLKLKLKGSEPTGTLNPGSSRLSRGYKKGGLFDPNRDDTIMYSSSTPSGEPIPPKKRKERRIGIDVSSNEKVKQSLLKDEQIELPPAYLGGPKEFREKADFFDVSAAIMGGGKEDMIDPETGKYFTYDRLATTEFGKSKKNKNRTIIFNHIKKNIGAENITREEFDKYATEQAAAEVDLRDAIRLLNLRAYASARYIDLKPYDTKEKLLAFLGEINKAKRPPKRRRDRETKEFTEDLESFEARTEIWKLETAPFQQYTDYKETYDYGHINSAKNLHRQGDVGANRISNTEIEASHNIVSRDPATQKSIEILQEGNRERGARRDFLPSVQMMRNTSATVIEDFVKWKAAQPGAEGPNLTAILDKFMPREQHDNFLKFIQKRFYERRRMSGSLREFMEEELDIPYEAFKKFPNKLKLKVKALYDEYNEKFGNVLGIQQYAQGQQWMQEAVDEFIGLHHFDKDKRLRTTKDDIQLKDIPDEQYEMFISEETPRSILDLLNKIYPTDE